MALFRPEVLAGRVARLEGEVALATPLPWQLLGGFLFAVVAAGALYLMMARTDRVLALETVIDPGGDPVALLRQADAAILPPGACGVLVFAGEGLSTRVCTVARDGDAPRSASNGDVFAGSRVRLRAAAPLPPGGRGTARFIVGQETLWTAVLR